MLISIIIVIRIHQITGFRKDASPHSIFFFLRQDGFFSVDKNIQQLPRTIKKCFGFLATKTRRFRILRLFRKPYALIFPSHRNCT